MTFINLLTFMQLIYFFFYPSLWLTELHDDLFVQEGDILLSVKSNFACKLCSFYFVLMTLCCLLLRWTGTRCRPCGGTPSCPTPSALDWVGVCVPLTAQTSEQLRCWSSFCGLTPTAHREAEILAAFQMISDYTCIRFVPHSDEYNYLIFKEGNGWGP